MWAFHIRLRIMNCVLWIVYCELWILNCDMWIENCAFWIMNCEFWIVIWRLWLWFWILDCGFWRAHYIGLLATVIGQVELFACPQSARPIRLWWWFRRFWIVCLSTIRATHPSAPRNNAATCFLQFTTDLLQTSLSFTLMPFFEEDKSGCQPAVCKIGKCWFADLGVTLMICQAFNDCVLPPKHIRQRCVCLIRVWWSNLEPRGSWEVEWVNQSADSGASPGIN